METVDAIILAGGMGTRLREVLPDLPKPLAPVGGVPFLEILLRSLDRSGLARRVVLALSYKAESIVERFRGRNDFRFDILFSVEEEPLGTGGAIRKALPLTESENVLVMNGDSYVEIDWDAFLADHLESGGRATIVLTHSLQAGRYGTVVFDDKGRIVSFREKDRDSADAWINAGVYLFGRGILEGIRQDAVLSLERDVLPGVLPLGIRAFPTRGVFIDIGIPRDYEKAKTLLKGRTQ